MGFSRQIFRIFSFTLGAACGIPIAFYILSIVQKDFPLLPDGHTHPVSDDKYYNNWLNKHGVIRVQTNCSTNSSKLLESDFLKRHLKITCVIFVNNLEAAYRVYNFWATKCDSYYFFGPETNEFVPIITSTHSKFPWQRLCKSLEYLILNEKHFNQWIVLTNDDKFVIPENLRYSLVLLNSSAPFYGGRIKSHRNILYSRLSNGIVLNGVALETLIQSNNLVCHIQNYIEPDFYLAKLLLNENIYPCKLLDENRCNRFHSISFNDLFVNHKLMQDDEIATSNIKDEDGICVSNTSVSFKMPAPKDSYIAYVYEYFLYNFKKPPSCYVHSNPPAYSTQNWLDSLTIFTNTSKKKILSMSNVEFYDLWNNISKIIPQTW